MAAGAIAGLAVVIGAIASALINNAQQKKASEEQQRNQERLSRQNQDIAMENWENTNAEAQRKQYEKAGLSVGMMYSKGGGQGLGATAQGQTSKRDVSEIDLGGAAGMGIQAGLQTKMQKAQIDNIEANTEKTKVDTAKTAGVDTEKTQAEAAQTGTNIAKIAQDTENAKIQGELMTLEQKMKELDVKAKEQTIEFVIQQIKSNAEKTINETRSATAKAEIDEKTKENLIKQINTASIEQAMRIATQKKGIQLTTEQIRKTANEINMTKEQNMREWDRLSNQDKDRMARKIAEATGDASLIDVVRQMLEIPSASNPVGFKY